MSVAFQLRDDFLLPSNMFLALNDVSLGLREVSFNQCAIFHGHSSSVRWQRVRICQGSPAGSVSCSALGSIASAQQAARHIDRESDGNTDEQTQQAIDKTLQDCPEATRADDRAIEPAGSGAAEAGDEQVDVVSILDAMTPNLFPAED